MLQRETIHCQLCVVGGGMAGIGAAIAAARKGIQVVLMQERPVLGGNASSEIRMWICGSFGENNRETGILEEISLENLYRNPTKNYYVWDTVLYDFVMRESNITLLLNCTCMDAKVTKGSFAHGRTTKIHSIKGYQLTTQRFYDVVADFYCDASGDSILAPLTGAEFRLGREGSEEFGELSSTKTPDTMTMGMTCMLQGRQTNSPVAYIPPEFSTPLEEKDFENRNPDLYRDTENFWYLELGGQQDTIGDTEILRHRLMGLAAGTWDHIKNSGLYDSENWELEFFGFLPGKRESRRMLGEYMLKQTDISAGRVFPDEIAYGGWPLDDHFPGGFFHRGVPNTYINTPAPYSIPYRVLYSANVDNLYFAGRNISATHMAMSSTRVMATCTLLGEAVGHAVALACQHHCTPHDVYLHYMDDLQESLLNADCFLPSKVRKISDACKNAKLNVSDVLRNGQDRPHSIYKTDDSTCCYVAKEGEPIRYTFEKTKVGEVHIVFDSDLNRKTLPGSLCERTHTTRCNVKLDSPVMTMPKTLCRSFRLVGICDGVAQTLLTVENNRKRQWHVEVQQELDTLELVLMSGWGDYQSIPVISFDFC